MYPVNLKYTETHEWVGIQGNILTLGITFYAQDQIKRLGGGLTYIGSDPSGGLAQIISCDDYALPEIGTIVRRKESFMVVESYKSVSEIFSPADGKIVAVNEKLTYRKNLDLVHRDPYGEGWFVKIEVENFDPSGLMDAEAYQESLEE